MIRETGTTIRRTAKKSSHLLVVPTRYDFALSISSCCKGRYGWKKASFPKRFSGRPI